MISYLMISRSLTQAQRTAKTLERRGITAIVSRTPHDIAEQGCGYCVKVSEKRLYEALAVLKKADLAPKRIFVMFSDGRYSEVSV